MFLKRKRQETDDFVRKISGCEGKIVNTLYFKYYRNVRKFLCISCISEYSGFFKKKTTYFSFADKGFDPPPPFAKNAIFFWTAPLSLGRTHS